MRYLLGWIAVAACVAWGHACGAAEDFELGEARAPHTAVVFEDSVQKTDKAFVEMARRGADQARKELNVKLDDYTIAIGEDREKELQTIAMTHPNMIVAVGFDNVTAVQHLATHYPDIKFVVIDGVVGPQMPNVQSIVFEDNEGAFLVGMLAALTSKTGIIGFVGGMDVPLIRNFAYGYEQGAQYVRKDIKVLRVMIGDTREAWSNPARAKILAKNQIDQGADIIFAAAGGSSLGVLEAAHDAGRYAIGIDTNQNALYPGTVLSSLVKRVDLAVFEAIRSSTDGKWKPGIKRLSAADGFLDYAVDSNNRNLISLQTIDRIEAAKDLMLRGTLRVESYSPN
jgi:basic membrane protein A